MARNRKIVIKPFTYLQCDDFADYLSKMAAQGWHFKEWGVGLVFEKGEPENAVYAVEVFYKGSEHGLRPDDDTLDFADYCEAAGWKLIDSRQKFCIFKQISSDATPILTPWERLENASKAYHRHQLVQLAITMMFIINFMIHHFAADQFIDSIFSNTFLLACVIYTFFFLYELGIYIWFWSWKYRTKKQYQTGQRDILRNKGTKIWNGISTGALILFTIGYGINQDFAALTIFLITIVAFILLAVFLGKVRPDKETNVGIQVLFSFLLIFILTIIVFSQFSKYRETQNKPQTVPLTYADLELDAGSPNSIHKFEDISILGSKEQCFLYYDNASLIYTVIKTDHQWILDVIWDDNKSAEGTIHGSVVDCSGMWDAEAAFYNGRDYYVRYDNSILILRFFKYELTEHHIAIIREVLGLEG